MADDPARGSIFLRLGGEGNQPVIFDARQYREVAAAATGGDVVVERMRPSDVRWLIGKLRAAGCEVIEGSSHVRVRRQGALLPVDGGRRA